MLTIGQLARYVGVSTKAIRVYHDKGLLPEPDRDTSGYRPLFPSLNSVGSEVGKPVAAQTASVGVMQL